MAKSGAASEEMALYINALVRDNENKSLCIGTLAKEVQSLSQHIQQCQMVQQVLAEVMKLMVTYQQPPPQQPGTADGVTVTEVEDDNGAGLDFRGGLNPQAGPPDIGPLSMMIQQPVVPTHMEVTQF